MNHRYTIPDKIAGLLTDIATEEFFYDYAISYMKSDII